MRLLHDFQRTVCRRRVFDTDGYTNTNLNIGVLNRENDQGQCNTYDGC